MIQWFPGHMHQNKKKLEELISEVDVVVEMLDARAPFSSCNPLIQSMILYKKKIRILNKADLADENITAEWINYFSQQNNNIAIKGYKNDLNQKNRLLALCKKLSPARISFEKPLRIMLTGIPNVGKSSLINLLTRKKTAQTGDVPALTKSNQRINLSDNIVIYDTPGMMWPKIIYPQIGYNLALCNSIGANAIDEETIARYLLIYLSEHYVDLIIKRYKLDLDKNDDLLKQIGQKRGAFLSGGLVDVQKTSEIIIKDFRDGKIGKLSLENPDLWQQWLKEFSLIEQELEIADSKKLLNNSEHIAEN